MNRDEVYQLFRNIHDGDNTPQLSAQSLKNKIITYVNNNAYIKNSIDASTDDDGLVFFFKPFNLTLRCKESFKLFFFPPVTLNSYELDFYFESNGEDISLLKIYTTTDGYVTKDVFNPASICDTQNEYRGKLVLNEILDALVNKKVITIHKQ